jgi:hypothetical protein
LKKGFLALVLSLIKNTNLALTFLLELGVLVALGYWGFQTGQATIASIGLGIGAPVLAVALFAAGQHVLGLAFALVFVLNTLLASLLEQ